MKKIKVAIVGYGNIGKYVLEAANSTPDIEVVGIVRRNPSNTPHELKDFTIVKNIKELKDVDVAILSTPSRLVVTYATECLNAGINTVDSYDIHSGIVNLRESLGKTARENNKVAIISAGWDPGTDSIIRSIFQFMAPKGITYTNFGPGMSMGHSVAAKAIAGVKDALSVTIPLGTGLHRRLVYIEVKEGHNLAEITKVLKADDYFSHDETHVFQVDSVDELKDMGHGVEMIRKGVSGITQNQYFDFTMRINNPALTAQVLVAAARASVKQQPGAYTLIEIPIIDFIYGEREKLIAKLV